MAGYLIDNPTFSWKNIIMARAGVEVLSYKIPEIEHAAGTLVHTFTKFSEIAGTRVWPPYAKGLSDRIKDQTPFPYLLRAPGFALRFSGFPPPNVPRSEGDELIFGPPDLGFAFLETDDLVLPSERTHIQKVTKAIAEEMAKVFHLDLNRDPLQVTLPRDLYVKEVVVFNAALI